MDRWFLIAATVLAAMAGVRGLLVLGHGRKSPWTVWWMIGVLLCQLGYLSVRGEMRGACPLRSIAEISVFLAWSLTLFYLLIGPAFRISLLGVFTAPAVALFQGFALIPGKLDPSPARVLGTTAWGETHSAMSVLAYGALALAAVAGVMFLVLDHQLKEHHLKGGLFRFLPPVRDLLVSLERLLWLGMALLTIGLIAGIMMPHETGGAWKHVFVASGVWAAYVALMAVKRVRGITGRRFALGAVALFVLSLGVFAFV
ncbi:cytochrome c biogenesis protein CcsA [Akkermansiaceae bacterium]|nr:cytochrome c biogenesis protein CcsA [Akkermansiaceae bacterium]